MSLDINGILNDWPYKAGRVNVRRIVGDDGREKIQMRLDLGLLQMEPTGRPDGQRPHGQESLLDYYELKLSQHRQKHGDEVGFDLDENARASLRAEGLLYYHRYLAEFLLENFEAVERDTRRNLRMFDFCSRYGGQETDRYGLEQYRPYVLMMNARARAYVALGDSRTKAALDAVKEGIDRIESFYRRMGQDEAIEQCGQIALLRVLGKDIEGKIPVGPIQKLRCKLAKAVAEERYEDAAVLHEKIRRAAAGKSPGPAK